MRLKKYVLSTFALACFLSSAIAQTSILSAGYPAAFNLVKTANGGDLSQTVNAETILIKSVKELALAAATSGKTYKMIPGVYKIQDYLTATVIKATVADTLGNKAMILFSGSNNVFDLTGVTIEVNTELLNDFGDNVIEFQVNGNNNHIKGLTVNDIGTEPTKSGGQSMVIYGENVKIEKVTLNMNGSSPYGYGDLLGKGSGSLAAMKKHSGLLVSGLNDTILDCTIISKSFGHLFFIQGGRNVYFENCYAEAVVRTTDDMLAETSGTAFDLNFAAVYKNYDGNAVITPGYTKSLSECGFRTYGSGGGNITGAVTLVNCKAKNVRTGFALYRVNDDIKVVNCEATGCEAGYSITGVNIEKSRGDAVNGPLIYIEGNDPTNVELDLIPNVNTTTLHAIACVGGSNHVLTINAYGAKIRPVSNVIIVGVNSGAGTNPFSPLGNTTTKNIILNNNSGMPVEVRSTVSASTINSNAAVTNSGTGNTVNIK